MTEHSHLHENEQLLAELRPGWSVLASALIGAILQALVVAIVVSTVVVLGMSVAGGSVSWPVVFSMSALFIAAALGWLQFRAWKHAHLRITTDRLLFHYGKTLFSRSRLLVSYMRRTGDHIEHTSQPSEHATVTVKWPQYQESHAGRPKLMDVFAGARPLSVRYGTADTEREVCFPGLSFAQDLKHYLDKVDSAVRHGKTEALRPFVLKPSGQRDLL
jgi:hypothetical protein